MLILGLGLTLLSHAAPMMAVAYSPLTSEDVQGDSRDPLTNRQSSENHENARSAVSSARSAKYYGETDNPASEDEDEALLDKVVPISPAIAELGEMHVDDDELELDPLPQVSLLPIASDALSSQRLSLTAIECYPIHRHLSRVYCRICSYCRHNSRLNIQGITLPNPWRATYHNGPYFQWHVYTG